MLSKKVLLKVGIDSFTDANKNDWTLLANTDHHFQDHLLHRSPGEGRYADAGVHVDHRKSIK
jgi:hypothetical protein